MAALLARLDDTTPHFVCCISPNECLHTLGEPGRMQATNALKFHEDSVSAQLKKGAVFEVVKLAQSGMPHRLSHREFYRRYRCIAIHHSELPQGLDTTSNTTSERLCETLILTLTSGLSRTLAQLQATISQELEVLLVKRKVREWMRSVGGILSPQGVKIGLQSVLLDRFSYSALELCLSHQLALCHSKIRGMFVRRLRQKRQEGAVRCAACLTRHARGFLARIRVKLLRQHKQEEAERLILSTPMGDTHLYSDQSKMLFEVRAYKSQDLTLYRSLKALGGGVVEEEVRIYIPAVRREFQTRSETLPKGALWNLIQSVVGGVEEGCRLLRADKLIPQSALSKALKLTNAPSNVSRAHKIVTQEHPCFKSFARIKEQ
eukprot:CAMPEP_0173279092 /NCGR_PEP_ID=MMETSP1143-20121109/4963_1 /TAXON_ID=483371 /ORGANISM="non described non described, Strain CCMP2298" /LENGTH=375 /DNA_ID=CAMNT_0014216295 /DNA_START=36 /DNA_END=1163 /DNA_ORIENTATION=+